jgi:hypothetical protein
MAKSGTRKLSTASLRELEALAAMRDEDIDFSDIPEVLDWSGSKRGLFYQLIKRRPKLDIPALDTALNGRSDVRSRPKDE